MVFEKFIGFKKPRKTLNKKRPFIMMNEPAERYGAEFAPWLGLVYHIMIFGLDNYTLYGVD